MVFTEEGYIRYNITGDNVSQQEDWVLLYKYMEDSNATNEEILSSSVKEGDSSREAKDNSFVETASILFGLSSGQADPSTSHTVED
ncbi:hypothetical protein SUGI_0482340 [Cryptomeria japonica]|nr:hypothetical protein SUGI_0482340 [Cryptomeria japonica]